MYSLIRFFLFLLPPETAHHVTFFSLSVLDKLGILPLFKPKSRKGAVTVMGLEFPNRIGLAAGLDKNGEAIRPLANLGFGFIEIGTVTPKPQPGNPAPRLFRLPKANAIINRMGFNNKGIDYLTDRVAQVRQRGFKGLIGINIGKNFDTAVEDANQDYLTCLQVAYPYADYITVNISSPNTPGLRTLQYGQELDSLLATLKSEQLKLAAQHNIYKPIAIKVAPDLSPGEVIGIAKSLLKNNMDAVIATNTTLSRDAVKTCKYGNESGGLSGAPVRELSTNVIKQLHRVLGNQIPIIGVGGIFSAKDAQEKLDAGAQLVQIYTGLIYKGPGLVRACVREVG